jgi:hypothetical protein
MYPSALHPQVLPLCDADLVPYCLVRGLPGAVYFGKAMSRAIYGYSVSTLRCPVFIVLLILCVWNLVCSLRDRDCRSVLLRRTFGATGGWTGWHSGNAPYSYLGDSPFESRQGILIWFSLFSSVPSTGKYWDNIPLGHGRFLSDPFIVGSDEAH